MESEIISREHIKPSLPTPAHLKTHKLSLLDMISPPVFVPLVLYFSAPEDLGDTSGFVHRSTQTLKGSLSTTLTRFHPLAGRVAEDGVSVDCNDEGILFVVSRIKGNLLDFLKKPDSTKYRLYVPDDLSWSLASPGSPTAMVQVNYFDCGGVAIGSLFLHTVTDGVTLATFTKAWAANAQVSDDDEEIGFPNYTAASLFPYNEGMQKEPNIGSAIRQYFKMGKTAQRRYVFKSSVISTIRTKLTLPGGLEFRPSQVAIVSALIWKCFIVASSSKNDLPQALTIQSVNVRRKADPPFPEHSFGNFVWLAPTLSINQKDVEVKDLIGSMRNSISKINSDFVRRMQGVEGFSGYRENVEETLKEFRENAEYLSISSWCNFGLYGLDFGWGRPLWISGSDSKSDKETLLLNGVWLMDTRDGDGIEAWVFIDEKYSSSFDSIQKLWGLATADPSPLEIENQHETSSSSGLLSRSH